MKKMIIVLAVIALITGCQSYEESVIQKADNDYAGSPDYVKRVDYKYTYLILKEEKKDEASGQIKQRVSLVVLQTGDMNEDSRSFKFVFDRELTSNGPNESFLRISADPQMDFANEISFKTKYQTYTLKYAVGLKIDIEPTHSERLKIISNIREDILCIFVFYVTRIKPGDLPYRIFDLPDLDFDFDFDIPNFDDSDYSPNLHNWLQRLSNKRLFSQLFF